jgi:hypothetical protein
MSLEPQETTPMSVLVKDKQGKYVPLAFCLAIFAITVLVLIVR